jgi:hypothetical protein
MEFPLFNDSTNLSSEIHGYESAANFTGINYLTIQQNLDPRLSASLAAISIIVCRCLQQPGSWLYLTAIYILTA